MGFPGLQIHRFDTTTLEGFLEGESQTRYEHLQDLEDRVRVGGILYKIWEIPSSDRGAVLSAIEGLLGGGEVKIPAAKKKTHEDEDTQNITKKLYRQLVGEPVGAVTPIAKV